jgi:hypothetical protein
MSRRLPTALLLVLGTCLLFGCPPTNDWFDPSADAGLDGGGDGDDDGAVDDAGDGSTDGSMDGSTDGSTDGSSDASDEPDAPLECPDPSCPRACAGGLLVDDDGCEICECRYDVVHARVADVEAPIFGTWASHNQRIVETPGGLFMTYQMNERDSDHNGDWMLLRSRDGGVTWAEVYSASGTRPPAVVADRDGAVHLVTSDPYEDRIHVYSFSAASDYFTASVHSYFGIPCDAKFTAVYDARWNNIYIATQYGRFFAIWVDTFGVIHDYQVFQHEGNTSPYSCAQYPQLALDSDGHIHFAMTTSILSATHVYRNILHVFANPEADGRLSWHRMPRAGETFAPTLSLPIQPDENGGAFEINDFDERGSPGVVSVHLTNFIVKGSFVHFYYTVVREGGSRWMGHYKRFNFYTGLQDIDLGLDGAPLSGDIIELTPYGGFFSTDSASDHDTPLFLTANELARGQLGTLVSYDNGASWSDYAVTDTTAPLQASNISGARHSDGRIFAAYNAPTGESSRPMAIMFVGFYPR